jgi:spermidine/putrescine transport system ATP-binding protein
LPSRALAVEPQVLLLDEPLLALDLRLRLHMRSELRAIQRRVGITFIYITHDQGEALTMSDRIAVMKAGVIEQVGDGRSVYDNPRTAFVASFVGENNGFEGTVIAAEGGEAVVETAVGRLRGRRGEGVTAGGRATLFVRPESLHLAQPATPALLTGTMTSQAFEGNATHLYLDVAGGRTISVSLSRREDIGEVAPGRTVGLTYAVKDAVVLAAAESGR